jgi:hypothetical protein
VTEPGGAEDVEALFVVPPPVRGLDRLLYNRGWSRRHAVERRATCRARYYRLRAEGRCTVCTIPVEDGQVRCPECRARNLALVHGGRVA